MLYCYCYLLDICLHIHSTLYAAAIITSVADLWAISGCKCLPPQRRSGIHTCQTVAPLPGSFLAWNVPEEFSFPLSFTYFGDTPPAAGSSRTDPSTGAVARLTEVGVARWVSTLTITNAGSSFRADPVTIDCTDESIMNFRSLRALGELQVRYVWMPIGHVPRLVLSSSMNQSNCASILGRWVAETFGNWKLSMLVRGTSYIVMQPPSNSSLYRYSGQVLQVLRVWPRPASKKPVILAYLTSLQLPVGQIALLAWEELLQLFILGLGLIID